MNEVTNEAVIERLIQSDQGKKIAADIMRDEQMHRIDMKAQIETLKRERGALAREHADAVEVTRQRLEAARKALTIAEAEHGQAAMAQAQHKAHYSSRISKLERELLGTAPASISQFIEWLNDAEDDCKGTAVIENAMKTDRINTHTSEAVREYFSNAASLRDRLAALRKARGVAEGLRALILDSDDIQQRLDSLRDNLPAVAMTFSHEK